MKETINVNIGQQAFTLDVDAYRRLTAYIEDVSQRLPEEDNETLADIEARIAEIFREKVPSPMMVVTLSIVESTIEQLGAPETFGQTSRRVESDGEESAEPKAAIRKLYRSRSKRILAGVCGGISDHLNVDVSLVRLAALFLFFTVGFGILYIILWIVMPNEPVEQINLDANVEPKQ